MINKATILGRLGQDPEMKHAASGTAICNVSVATSETWKDKNTGEKQQKSEWHRVAAFGKLAQIMGDYLRKGSLVYIEGRIQTRKWTDKDGQDRYSTEIIANEMKMLDGKPADGGNRPAQQQTAQQQSQPAPAGGDDFDDDLPFGPVPMEAGG